MKKNYIVVLSIIIISFIITLVVMNETRNNGDDELTIADFGSIRDIVKISSVGNRSNFDITIKQGDYSKGDSVYVFNGNTDSLYSKYELTDADVEGLKEEDLNLFLSYSQNVDVFRMQYVIVKDKKVTEFEENFNDQDAFGNYRNLYPMPNVKEFDGTSSLDDEIIIHPEYELDNEKVNLILMQSQRYIGDVTVMVVDYRDETYLQYELTPEQLSELQHDNVLIRLDAKDFVNQLEGRMGNHDFYVKILNGDGKKINAFYFQINVS